MSITESIKEDLPAWLVRSLLILLGTLTFGYVVFWSDDHNDARYIKQPDWKREQDRVLDVQKEHAERIKVCEYTQRQNELQNMSVSKDLVTLKNGQDRMEEHLKETIGILKAKQ